MITRLMAAMLMLGSTAMAAQVSPEPTFNKDVLPVLQKNCQGCHRPGQIAPMSFLSYQSTRPWARAMKAAVASRKMPPWFADPAGHIINNSSLAQRDIDTITTWADAGAPEGDVKDAPALVQWPSDGWQIKPDVIVDGPEFKVPAKGVVEWTNITVPGPFKEDTWITSIELLPGDRTVTHHICITFKPHLPDTVYYQPTFTAKVRDEAGNEDPRTRKPFTTQPAGTQSGTTNNSIQFCYLPGSQFDDYRPFGAGKLIPAGTDISFGMHYTTTGKEVVDRPRLGFTVSKEAPQRQYVNYIVNATQNPTLFAIPPNNPRWEAPVTEATFEEDVELVWVASHMHVRGKDTIWELTYPDGRKQTILSLKNYDYNWQLGYQFKPMRIPKGTKLTVRAWYDNSANNRANPDPNRTVYWGDQAWEEMMSAFVAVIVNKGDARRILRGSVTAGGGGN